MDCEEEKENEKNNMQVGIRTVTQVFSTFSCLDVSYEPFIVFFFCFVFLDMTGGKKKRHERGGDQSERGCVIGLFIRMLVKAKTVKD